jgi:predicted transcriptional regulator
MITAAEREELVEWVKNLDDAYIIQQLIELKRNEEDEFETKISDAEKTAIDQALDSYQEGRFHTQDEVEKHLKKKFPQLFKD